MREHKPQKKHHHVEAPGKEQQGPVKSGDRGQPINDPMFHVRNERKAAQQQIKRSMKAWEKADAAKGKDDGKVDFTDAEAGTIEGQKHGDLAEDAAATGETAGEEHAKPEGDGFEGDQIAADGAEKIGADIGGAVAGKAAGTAVLVPHIVSLLRKHDYNGALKLVWSSVGIEDRAELLKLVVEKLAGELSEHALSLFVKFAIAGAVLDVLALGWEWTKLGLQSIYEAHEKGDQKARIRIYAYAWSDVVLRGEHSNPGAVTAEEREALKLGIEDGLATRQAQPELPALLMAEYHNEKMAREKLELALMKRAGIE